MYRAKHQAKLATIKKAKKLTKKYGPGFKIVHHSKPGSSVACYHVIARTGHLGTPTARISPHYTYLRSSLRRAGRKEGEGETDLPFLTLYQYLIKPIIQNYPYLRPYASALASYARARYSRYRASGISRRAAWWRASYDTWRYARSKA